MIRSMTGFARVRRQLESGELTVSIKSVNHRGLDPHFHLTAELEPYEPALREIIKREVLRGHLDVRVSLMAVQTAGVNSLNLPMLRECFAAFTEATRELGFPEERFDLNSALRIPGVVGGGQGKEPDPAVESALLSATAEALETLNGFRAREGAEIAAGIRVNNSAILQSAGELSEIRTRAVPIMQARLAERLRDLLRSAAVDPQRLTQEAAMLADRSDIGEEIERLDIHSRQLEGMLDTGGEVGKKVDFLLQEMHRETNTILSKTNGIGELGLKITGLALSVKSRIEKIREQALNLE